MINYSELKNIIATKDKTVIANYMKMNDLVLKEGKIVPRDNQYCVEQADFWDQRQQARKILLNSLYGALLNESMRMYDERVGQSVTLTGRSIVRHMNAKINENITGVYDYRGDAIVYADTDSVAKESIIRTNIGDISIESLFNECEMKFSIGDKEYAKSDRFQVVGFDSKNNKATFSSINYVYRHKVKKSRYKITDASGKTVIVTEDHSIMVERNKTLVEVKPSNLVTGDVVISINKI